MILNLSESNKKQIKNYQERIIEDAFQHSQQLHYRMPKIPLEDSESDFDDIPSQYDLHQQNRELHATRIVGINKLIRINSKKRMKSTQMF